MANRLKTLALVSSAAGRKGNGVRRQATGELYFGGMRGAILLLFSWIPLIAQQASIEGIASDAITHAPLGGVHVRIFIQRQGAPSIAYGAMSDGTGRFSIRTIAPGTYHVNAERAGFVYTGKRTVAFTPAQNLTDFKLEMTAQAIISGHVFDQNGDPVQGASIGIIQAGEGEPIEPPQASATNEKGEFRARGAPGEYYVQATPAPVGLGNDPKEIFAPGVSPVFYVETWFPYAASKDRATVIEAVAGQETRGIDIRLTAQKPLTISGVLKGMPEGTEHSLIEAERTNGEPHMATVGGDGKFTFGALTAGTYNVMVVDAGGLASRRVEVKIDRSNVTDLELTLQGPEKLTGTLEAPGDRTKLRVVLEHSGEPDFPFRRMDGGEVDKNGAFTIDGVFPGHYRAVVTPLPGNSYVREVRLDDVLADGVVDLPTGMHDSKLKIVVSPDGGEISGAVQTNAEASVFLVADPAKIREDERVDVSPDGAYVIHGIRPGKYRLFAVDESQYGATDSLSSIAAKATEVEIKPGERLKKDLMLVDVHAK